MREDLFKFPPVVDQNLDSLAGKQVKVVTYDGSRLKGEKSKGFPQGMTIEFTDGTRLLIASLLVQEEVAIVDSGKNENAYFRAHVPVVRIQIV